MRAKRSFACLRAVGASRILRFFGLRRTGPRSPVLRSSRPEESPWRTDEISDRSQLHRRLVRRRRSPRSRRLQPERRQRHLARAAFDAARGGRRRPECQGGVPGVVHDADQGARAGLLQVQGASRAAHRRAGGARDRGEREDPERGPSRGLEVRRAHRVRLLAPADHAGGGARGEPRRGVSHRALPVRRRGGDHAVQLPEHGAELVASQRDRARKLFHTQTIGAGAAQRGAHRRAARRGGTAQGRAADRARRQGDGGGDLRPLGDRGDQLRRLHQGGQGGLPARHGEPQARARVRRRQEPSDRASRCGPRDDGVERRGVDVRMRGAAVHGRLGDGRRRQDGPHHRAHEGVRLEDGAGEGPGAGDLGAGQGAHRELHRGGRGRRRQGARGRAQRQGTGE